MKLYIHMILVSYTTRISYRYEKYFEMIYDMIGYQLSRGGGSSANETAAVAQ